MEEMLQMTKAPIAKIWHILEAKSIAALEKYVSVPRLGQYLIVCIIIIPAAVYHRNDSSSASKGSHRP